MGKDKLLMTARKSVIGINFGHSSSVCLINGYGELSFAVEEDKLIKEKHTSKFPINGLDMVLERGLSLDQIEWAEGWNIYHRLLKKGVWHSLLYFEDKSYLKGRALKELLRFIDGVSKYRRYGHFYFIGHHLAHAYSLVPYGLQPKSIICVSDTIGETESISFFYWDGRFKLLRRIDHPNSMGSVYHQIAYHVGFKGRTGPGKLMALSGYGSPVWLKEFSKISETKDGFFSINQKAYPSYRLKDAPNEFIKRLSPSDFKNAFVQCENNYLHGGENIAATLQEWLKINSWNLIQQNIDIARKKFNLEVNHIGLVGGTFLNCQINGFIVQNKAKLDIDTITVSPWSDDSGTAIGAAVGRFLLSNPNASICQSSPFLGPEAVHQKQKSCILGAAIEAAADKILQGGLIALVSGKLEFGPRALGGRCLIGSAFLLDSKHRMNKCKSRLPFMPFAPVVLEQDYGVLFHGSGSNNMAWTVGLKKDATSIIPGAWHVTGEARVQVIKSDNCLLYELLLCVKRKTGVGIALLTSLNNADDTVPVSLSDSKVVSKSLGLDGILSDEGWSEF